MTHTNHRKIRPPEVWDQVRAFYIAGETGPSLARRFDVGLDNLRRKAAKEGWSRNCVNTVSVETRATPPPVADWNAAPPAPVAPPPAAPAAPPAAPRGPAERAAELIAAGRPAEALAMIKAAEALSRLTGAEAAATPGPPSQERARELQEVFWAQVWSAARRMAEHLLEEDPSAAPSALSGPLFRWRAERLGEEVARADFQAAVAGGWADRFWDKDGALLPPPPPREPIDGMWDQHARGAAWRAERGMGAEG